jgi:hypothetical protein
MSASMRYEDLLALSGRECRLSLLDAQPAIELSAVLAEVTDRRERQGYEQFSLLFRASEQGAPQQGIYSVSFDGDEARECFLVPIGREGDEVSYEACFNRESTVVDSAGAK